MRQLRQVVPVLFSATAALFLWAAPAQALSVSSTTTTEIDGTSFSGGTAACGPGEKVISGGFVGEPNDFAEVNKAAGKDAWRVEGEFSSPGTVFAYCSSRLEVSVEKKTESFRDDLRGGARARCEKGEVVSGGWSYSERQGNSPVYTSFPTDPTRWTVKAFSDGAAAGPTLTAYAYCLKDANPKPRTGVTALPDRTTNSGVAEGTAECESGEQLLGGGFKTTPRPDFFNADGPDPFFYESARDGKRTWRAGAINYSELAGTVKVAATCLD